MYERKTNRKSPNYVEKSAICVICNEIITSIKIGQAINNHVKNMHNIDPQLYYIQYINPNANILCPICKKPTKFKNAVDGFSKTCGNKECISKNQSQVMSSAEVQQKKINTTLERYGVEHHLQNPEIMAKQVKTNIEHLGVEHALQDENIKHKVEQTMISKFGVAHSSQVKSIRQKQDATRRRTLIEKYGTADPFHISKKEDLIMSIKPIETLGNGKEVVCIFYYDVYKKSVSDGEPFACKICAIPHVDFDKYFTAITKFVPEIPVVGLAILTDSSVELKTTIQYILNARKKQLKTAPSADWYNTSIDEIKAIYNLILGQ